MTLLQKVRHQVFLNTARISTHTFVTCFCSIWLCRPNRSRQNDTLTTDAGTSLVSHSCNELIK